MTLRNNLFCVKCDAPVTEIAKVCWNCGFEFEDEPNPDFCGDQDIFPQNDQEFEELWQHHFSPAMRPTKPHLPTKPIRIGGLLRCCTANLRESQVREEDGEVVTCKYCKKSSMIFHNGTWQWNRPHLV